jgi:hypothetical protein
MIENLVKVCNSAEPSCPCAHYKGLWGSGGPDPLLLNLETNGRLHNPVTSYTRGDPIPIE